MEKQIDKKMLTVKASFSCMLTMKVVFFFCFKFFQKSLSNAQSMMRKFVFIPDFQPKHSKYSSIVCKSTDVQNVTLLFHMEEALLRSSSLFPYFMLVAFEAGGLLRALILFLSYPLVCLFSKKLRIKILVFLCFFGIRKEKFSVGRSVLPKYFLEDVGYEGFEVMMRYQRKMAASDLPTVMVESFLKDYLGVDVVIGRELKVGYGYFTGLMDERERSHGVLNEIVCQGKINSLVGFNILGMNFSQQVFSYCKVCDAFYSLFWLES